jgi:hypothetical protein
VNFTSRLVAGIVGTVLLVGLALSVLLLPHFRITDSSMAGTADRGSEVYLAKQENYAPGSVVTIQYGSETFTRKLTGYKSDGTLLTADGSGTPDSVRVRSGETSVTLKPTNIVGEVVLVVPHGREVTFVVFLLLVVGVGWCFLSAID